MSKISLDLQKENELIKLSKKDKKYFTPLYKHYMRHIMTYLYARTNDKLIAEELTSKTFEKALKGLDNFQWQGVSFSAWLYRIAKNTLVDYFRKNEKKQLESHITEESTIASPLPQPDKEYEENYENEVLYKVLNDLPPRERDIVYMKFFDGYTNRVIAELTDLSETNVGTIIYRAIRKMREEYAKL